MGFLTAPSSGAFLPATRVATVANGVETRDAAILPRRSQLVGDQRLILFIALVVLNIADVITTALVLADGGVETNPFIKPIVSNTMLLSLLKAAVLALVGALLLRCRGSKLAEVALTVTTGWYFAVVVWNLAVLALL